MENKNMSIRSCFKNIQNQLGLTQEELAEELKVSRTSLSLWMSHKRQPSVIAIRKMIKILKEEKNIHLEFKDFRNNEL